MMHIKTNLLKCSEDDSNYKFVFTASKKMKILLVNHCRERERERERKAYVKHVKHKMAFLELFLYS